MNRILETGRFSKIAETVDQATVSVCVTGVSDSRSALIGALALRSQQGVSLALCPGWHGARRMAQNLTYLMRSTVLLMPESDPVPLHFDARSREDLTARLRGLIALANNQPLIVVASIAEAVRPLPPLADFLKYRLQLAPGQIFSPQKIRERLRLMGYERVGAVEAHGQYSSRGDLVDLFPLDRDEPVRIDFFDDQIDNLRSFDPYSQRSTGNIETLTVLPAKTLLLEDAVLQPGLERLRAAYAKGMESLSEEGRQNRLERWRQIADAAESGINLQLLSAYLPWFYQTPDRLWDYLPADSMLVVDDPNRMTDLLQTRLTEAVEWMGDRFESGAVVPEEVEHLAQPGLLERLDTIAGQAETRRKLIWLSPFEKGPEWLEAGRTIAVKSSQTPSYNGRMDFLEAELKRCDKNGYATTLVAATSERAENLENFTSRLNLNSPVKVELGELSEGIRFPEEKLLIIPDRDIFISGKRRRSASSNKRKTIQAFVDLKLGDYVVHDSQGIGQFEGTVQMDVQGVRRDYLKIKYAGTDVLYVPVEQMDLVQKYSASDAASPRLSRLGGGEWKRTRERVKSAIKDMARELLAVSAARQLEPGYAFSRDSVWQQEFEDQFAYEETPDQLRSIKEIKRDMESPRIMDRLLCGDVGYGKTEVAARALFKCAAEGRQAALLVPTTLLASQHLKTLENRFSGFPMKVEMLSRFRSPKQQKDIVGRVRTGDIDVIIGTHRLLSADIHFKDLGLLVIDEEQHFGVQHKEAIKRLRQNVDVLTLSATPIPRTLHMSLAGIRDISLIEEPPEERYPIRTYVLEQDDAMIREVIERELDRGGQVYVIYNRVRGIQQITTNIQKLVPRAAVVAAHGQMKEEQLEKIMMDFIENRYQVLVATTIVESGLDIPNVNTIIILNADHFGLSQLYQLRGRVGRSNRLAYAYLMYQKNKIMTEVAEKRLKTIREFTEFGAGFQVAMRDLEIRGAGNLLGAEQHGHLVTIGYEMYSRLVAEAVRELNGVTPVTPLTAEASVDLDVEGYIPGDYIEDETQRLQMYKRIAGIQNDDDRLDVMDELIDRYGDPPLPTINLTFISLARALAERSGIREIARQQQNLLFYLDPDRKADSMIWAELAAAYGSRLLIHGGQRPYLKLSLLKEKPLAAAIDLLTKILNSEAS
jgi:transcription-repair coupling factor (superfamily II helicase)